MIDTHYVSMNLSRGRTDTLMERRPLADALRQAIQNAPEGKHDCWLISNGYKDTSGKYTREEFNFQWIDTILLDVDNHGNDAELLERFKSEFERYSYILWQTASSTIECPKFRAIFPLDRKVAWVNEPRKYTKLAIRSIFSKWTDDKASWYFTPTRGKLNTILSHRGESYPAANIEWTMNSMKSLDLAIKHSTSNEFDVDNLFKGKRERNPDGWRNFKTVKECLGHSLPPHERHDPLFKACSAMALNGYKDAIPQFLSEVDCPQNHKREMLRQFK